MRNATEGIDGMEIKVLVIEDDMEIIDSIILSFRVTWPEAEVVYSNHGVQGISKVKTEEPDIVLLDLGLPDISGYEVLKQIRMFSAVPVIILTVRSEEDDVIKALEGEANDYVVKPFRQKELMARVRAQITQYRTNAIRNSLD